MYNAHVAQEQTPNKHKSTTNMMEMCLEHLKEVKPHNNALHRIVIEGKCICNLTLHHYGHKLCLREQIKNALLVYHNT